MANYKNREKDPVEGESTSKWGLRTINCYRKISVVGHGTYGQVWKGKNRISGRLVALKKIRVDPYRKNGAGTSLQVLREIRILNSFSHPNIVELIEVATSAKTALTGGYASMYLVFEYLEHDLGGLIDEYNFTEDEIKCFFMQLMRALKFMHENRICHRDIKSSNLLISNNHALKVADFGLARQLQPLSKKQQTKYTNKVITLWYRPPELLLGEEQYDYSVDIWSAGCILLEMHTKTPCFQGRNEMDQLKRIFKLCGRPSVDEWPSIEQQAYKKSFDKYRSENYAEESRKMDQYLNANKVSPDSREMIISLLQLNPAKRPSSSAILDTEYVKNSKEPRRLPKMKIGRSLHEYTTKKLKKEQMLLQGQQKTLESELTNDNNNNTLTEMENGSINCSTVDSRTVRRQDSRSQKGSRNGRNRSRSRSRSRSRDRGRGRERVRDRSRDKVRERSRERGRGRSRSRSRERVRERSRDREYHRRDRDKGRYSDRSRR